MLTLVTLLRSMADGSILNSAEIDKAVKTGGRRREEKSRYESFEVGDRRRGSKRGVETFWLTGSASDRTGKCINNKCKRLTSISVWLLSLRLVVFLFVAVGWKPRKEKQRKLHPHPLYLVDRLLT